MILRVNNHFVYAKQNPKVQVSLVLFMRSIHQIKKTFFRVNSVRNVLVVYIYINSARTQERVMKNTLFQCFIFEGMTR